MERFEVLRSGLMVCGTKITAEMIRAMARNFPTTGFPITGDNFTGPTIGWALSVATSRRNDGEVGLMIEVKWETRPPAGNLAIEFGERCAGRKGWSVAAVYATDRPIFPHMAALAA